MQTDAVGHGTEDPVAPRGTDAARNFAKQIRRYALLQTARTGSSHIGASLSVADILAGIYSRAATAAAIRERHADREVVLLSKGHAAAALYGALAAAGILSERIAETFADDNSDLLGHASHHVPGVEFSTGALGHGLPIAVGVALAKRLRSAGGMVTCILGDGECNEGSVWEAAMIASHHKLGNLRAIIDVNRQQGLGDTARILDMEPAEAKWQAFGWRTLRIDGHSHEQIADALADTDNTTEPTAILARSTKGKGVKFMENRLEWHYKSPNAEQLRTAMEGLDTK